MRFKTGNPPGELYRVIIYELCGDGLYFTKKRSIGSNMISNLEVVNFLREATDCKEDDELQTVN